MAALPGGTVTFLFTDIEGSTVRWERHPGAMRQALARHDTLLYEGIAAHGGVVLTERGEGDCYFALFARPSDRLAAACPRKDIIARWSSSSVAQPLGAGMGCRSAGPTAHP